MSCVALKRNVNSCENSHGRRAVQERLKQREKRHVPVPVPLFVTNRFAINQSSRAEYDRTYHTGTGSINRHTISNTLLHKRLTVQFLVYRTVHNILRIRFVYPSL